MILPAIEIFLSISSYSLAECSGLDRRIFRLEGPWSWPSRGRLCWFTLTRSGLDLYRLWSGEEEGPAPGSPELSEGSIIRQGIGDILHPEPWPP